MEIMLGSEFKNSVKIMRRFTLLLIITGVAVFAPGTKAQQTQEQDEKKQRVAISDSLLESYSIEELLQYREYYQRQVSVLERERRKLREQGILDGESFLRQHPESRILDKVLMRLAELYYQVANEEFIEAMQEYDQKMEQFEASGIDTTLPEPTKNYDRSLSMYQQIIDEFPQSQLVDDALYNKGFLLEELGRNEEALAVYQSLINEFPDSRYVPEALLRTAEYYFNPPVNDLEKAIDLYKQILRYQDSPKYDEALYRLGWSYYRLSQYPEAVGYFTMLADDIERSRYLDPGYKYTNPTLRDESVEYIGISFLDFGGPEKAVQYLEDIGGRSYGYKILKKIGDVYMEEKEEYERAIQSYQLLLSLYPDLPEAPKVQAKIVEAYRHQQDDMMSYLARDKLYLQYKPGSSWWEKNRDEKLRREVHELTEKALRDNINLLFQRAEESNDADLYLQAINDSRKYLQSFPSDSSAPLIHWNMALTLDTKLKRYDEAYDEYMKISDVYWNSKYQKLAAENAIALARDAVATDSTAFVEGDKSMSIGQIREATAEATDFKEALQYKRKELNQAEKKLAQAYDNYIKLFPHEPETAVILANAGALYYNHNQFPRALTYFNTLVKHFPDSKNVSYAQYIIMESYFGKHDFKSSEIVAKRLKNSNASPEIIEKAGRRLAESIFLSAEALADSGEHLKAGNEFIRAVLEVPNVEFADLALFNAALEYDKAKEFRRAVETYNYLIETQPRSRYVLDAMNNLALNYGELGEYRNAAITYEKLSTAHLDSSRAQDALYNASIFYVRAEAWEDAIRVNKNFVERFPHSPDADDLYFDIASYYLKIDDFDNANKIYGEYASKYPDSPRVIESYYNRGKYYEERNKLDLAVAEFEKAVAKNEEFKSKNMELNDYFAAEALFSSTKLKFDEYDKIEFRLPLAQMGRSKEKKKQLLLEIVGNLTKVASYGTIRLYEATYNIGNAYEEFAETWARQELPPMEETRRIVAQKEINETTAELYERAVTSYTQAVKVLSRLADTYAQSLVDTVAADSVAEASVRVTPQDSTLRVARKWIERSKEKISEVIYDIAELNNVSVNQFLMAPIPEGLDRVAEMEYRKQVLSKAVAPLVNQIVEAHTRNVRKAVELGLENQWVKLSRNKIVTTNNILPIEYNKLAIKAIELYQESSDIYGKLIEEGGTTPDGLDAIGVADQMANLIDFSKAFAKVSVELYNRTLENARTEGIEDPSVTATEEVMMRNLFLITQKWDSLAEKANIYRRKYDTLFKDTDEPEYEDALFTFEDNYFTLKEAVEELLEIGYNISQEKAIQNQWTSNILLNLVRSDPEQYGELLDLKVQTQTIYSDVSWLASTVYTQGWTEIDYDDSRWKPAQAKEAGVRLEEGESQRIWLTVFDTLAVVPDTKDTLMSVSYDSTVQDTSLQMLVTQKPEIVEVPGKRVFFRKAFNLQGLPVSAQIRLSSDDSYNLFLNGEYIAASPADTSNWVIEHSHQLSDFLITGQNVLAIEAIDSDGTGHGLKAVLTVKSLPGWDEQQKRFEVELSSKKIEINLIFDKNILLVR